MSSQLVRIIREICAEEDISLSAYADEYILCLTKNGARSFVYGNKFANNNASAEQICDDKAGLSALLAACGIPCVPHFFFAAPDARWYASDADRDREELLRLLRGSPGGLVVKENKGSGGVNVFHVTAPEELFAAADRIFSLSPSMAVSPFIDIGHEYRVLMLGTECRYAFEKLRLRVTGNGVNTVDELIAAANATRYLLGGGRGAEIPADGVSQLVEWRHNLGQGAVPELVRDNALLERLAGLARQCMLALGLGFASVDIIDDGGVLRVLEINSGVMIDNFSSYSPEYYALAKSGIRAAVLQSLGLGA